MLQVKGQGVRITSCSLIFTYEQNLICTELNVRLSEHILETGAQGFIFLFLVKCPELLDGSPSGLF